MTMTQGAGLVVLGAALGVVLILGKEHFDTDAVKVLIVTDGSVNAFTTNSDLDDKDQNDRKHKWNVKAKSLEINTGDKETPCFGAVKTFDMDDVEQVTFDIVADDEITGPPPSCLTTFTASNEGNAVSKKLRLTMMGDWEFKRKAAGRTLAKGKTPVPVKLNSIAVKPRNKDVETFSSPGQYLCAIFKGD